MGQGYVRWRTFSRSPGRGISAPLPRIVADRTPLAVNRRPEHCLLMRKKDTHLLHAIWLPKGLKLYGCTAFAHAVMRNLNELTRPLSAAGKTSQTDPLAPSSRSRCKIPLNAPSGICDPVAVIAPHRRCRRRGYRSIQIRAHAPLTLPGKDQIIKKILGPNGEVRLGDV